MKLTVVQCECLECQSNTKLKDRLKGHYDGFGKDADGLWQPFKEDTQAILCPPFVQGYALFKKVWVYMDINCVTDIDENKLRNRTTLDKVVLPQGEEWRGVKDLIRDLISSHGVDSEYKYQSPGPLEDIVRERERASLSSCMDHPA